MCEGSRTGMTAALTQKDLWDLRVILHSPQLLLHNLLVSEVVQYLHHRPFPSCSLTCPSYPYWHSDQLSSSVELGNGKMTTRECKDCPCLMVCSETSGCWARSPLSPVVLNPWREDPRGYFEVLPNAIWERLVHPQEVWHYCSDNLRVQNVPETASVMSSSLTLSKVSEDRAVSSRQRETNWVWRWWLRHSFLWQSSI